MREILPTEYDLLKEIERVFEGEFIPDFKDEKVQRNLEEGFTNLEDVWLCKTQSGHIWPHVVGGCGILSEKVFYSEDPYTGKAIAAFYGCPSPSKDFEKAMSAVAKAQKRWEKLGWRVRAEFLYRLAHFFMREDVTNLCVASLMTEVGMSRAEAWGEYNEVYRFLLQTALFTMREYTPGSHLPSAEFTGNTQFTKTEPCGIGVAVCPFNFPLAIPTNMLSYMLAFGNVVFLKGSDKTALTTRILFAACESVLEDMGIRNDGIVNYTPGPGGEMVRFLLSRKDVKLFSFTGSSEVFQNIMKEFQFIERERGNQLQVGCAETSGVNIMLICEDADSTESAKAAVSGIAGRSSQKCSSTKIILAHDSVCERVLEEIQRGLEALSYGNVLEGAYLGPLISGDAKARALCLLQVLLDRKIVSPVYIKKITPSPSGYDVAPTVLLVRESAIKDTKKMKILFNTEMFAPIVTVVPYKNKTQAKWLMRHSLYGLTGTVFAEGPKSLAWGLETLSSGMRYIRRKQTGATVAERFHGAGGTASSYNGGMVGQSLCARHYTPIELSGTLPKHWTGEDFRKFMAEFGENIRVIKKPNV